MMGSESSYTPRLSEDNYITILFGKNSFYMDHYKYSLNTSAIFFSNLCLKKTFVSITILLYTTE